MKETDIRDRIQLANMVFGQIGIRFNLLGIETLPNSSGYWNIVVNEWTGALWWRRKSVSRQVQNLIQAYNVSGCINLYFVGDIRKGAGNNDSPNGFQLPGCMFVKSGSADQTLAHEFGHMLGLWDCYDYYSFYEDDDGDGQSLQVPDPDLPISSSRFQSRPRDWGDETGRGFYASTDTYRRVLQQFIMFGAGIEYHYNFDMPDGTVECLNNNNHSEVGFGFGEIGAANVKPTSEGVYAK